MKRPMTPKLSNPPMTPAKMRRMGRFAPRVMSQGRSTLSIRSTTSVQTRKNVPRPGEPDQYSQITPGIITSAGPSCAMQSTNTTAVSSPARGMSASHSPRPETAVWIRAVTITPRATARIA